MTLYDVNWTADKSGGAWVRSHIDSLVRMGVLVPVEPCDCMNGWRCNCSWVDNGDGTRRADREPCTTQTRCTRCEGIGETP